MKFTPLKAIPKPWSTWRWNAMRALGVFALGALCLLVVLVFVADLPLRGIEVACRTPGGEVILVRPSAPGAADPRWRYGRQPIGPKLVAPDGFVDPGGIDCDPSRITPADLAPLENGVITRVALTVDEQPDVKRARLTLRKDMSGDFTFRWTYRNGQITSASASRRVDPRAGLLACAAFLIVSIGPLLSVLGEWRRRRAAR